MRKWSVIIILLPFITSAAIAEIELGVKDRQFALNGKPTFLLGISYYGALAAPQEFVKQDLDDIQSYGFNWICVWATWRDGITAVDKNGQPQEPYWDNLKWLVAECDRRGLVVDVTLSHGKIGSLQAHHKAVEAIVDELKPYRNWYIDLDNEHDLHKMPFEQLKQWRDKVKKLDRKRLVTASYVYRKRMSSYKDLRISQEELRQYLFTVQVDFLTPHLPRDIDSPRMTTPRIQKYFELMSRIGRVVPVHYQEPFRCGFKPEQWDPIAEDFLQDLKAAMNSRAAGWCFHNGDQRNDPGGNPKRSFDMRQKRLFEQLDDQERKFLEQMP